MPQIVAAVYAVGPRTLTVSFDVAMDVSSGLSNPAEWSVNNAAGQTRVGDGANWLDAVTLELSTAFDPGTGPALTGTYTGLADPDQVRSAAGVALPGQSFAVVQV